MLGSESEEEVMHMLGARIAALRREAGLSQSQLAQMLKISPSAMGMYEQGRREPSVQTLVELARVLEVSTDYLLTGCPGPGDQDRLTRLLLDRVRFVDDRLSRRQDRPFSREELAVLFAALLIDHP